jgi:hypothetical protein
MFSFARIAVVLLAGEAARQGRAQRVHLEPCLLPQPAIARCSGRRKTSSCSFSELFLTTAVPSLGCRRPSIRTLGERLMRSVYIGCSRYSRRCHLLGRPLVPSVMGRGPGQGRSPRNSALACGVCRPFLNYAAASLRFCVLWSGSYASH